MFGYLIIGGILTFVVVPAVRVAMRVQSKSARAKSLGQAGESAVDYCLRRFKGKKFARVQDLLLPSRGKTSQIDNLLISPYGIFVIEMKNYSGIIKGRADRPKWLQTFPRGKYPPREFPNPLWQNEGHIRALQFLLARSHPHVPFYNLAVFSDKATLPNIPDVVALSDLRKALKDRMQGEAVLSEEDVASIKTLLEKNNLKDKTSRAEHVEYAKNTASKVKQREIDAMLRERALANKPMADKVQQTYWTGRAALNRRIEEAELMCDNSRVQKPVSPSIDR